jgi:hypothetical protein
MNNHQPDDKGQPADTAGLAVAGSTPSTLLTSLDQQASRDTASLGGSSHYLTALNVSQSGDLA